ncbi:MAG: 50S ribosomal protein L31 [Dehalococcoidia bacterium]|nr:50S ribosomal protein L31 [Dehalococcoidia bacterium]
MKTGIHPTWYPQASVTCQCGNAFTLGSTKAELRVEICGRCHPHYTGEHRGLIDTEGRVERLKRKYKLK